MLRTTPTLRIAALVALLALCGASAPTHWCYPVLVHRVVDGDTIHVTLDLGFRLRIHQLARVDGIDTPELRSRSTLEKQAARVAQQAVVEWCKKHSPLTAQSVAMDKFSGRFVARIYGNNGDRLAPYLLELGVAREYDGGKRQPWTEEQLHEILSRNVEDQ